MKKHSKRGGGKEFQGPGLWETVKEFLLGVRRPFDCIQVEVTSRCPGRCTYCPHTAMREKWRSRDMTLDTFTRLWPVMRRAGRVHLQGWGEPLLNPALFDMAALARKAGCAVSTTTCGLHMNRDLALKIVESGMDIVAFSLAGTDAATNASRQGVEFERVCDAISVLDAVRKERTGVHLEVHIAYLMLASNVNAVRGLPALMKRLGAHAAVISTLDLITEPGLDGEAFSPQESEKLARASAILAETGAAAGRAGLGFHYKLPNSEASGTRCRENITRSFVVSADGFVSPCVYVNLPAEGADSGRRAFGNVREQSP
ncbi:MAG: radical SAM protein, partial [Proteobacteria bacterium]|nr:radical SAM protein [Pseudomonadota bacterium]